MELIPLGELVVNVRFHRFTLTEERDELGKSVRFHRFILREGV
jgi:hypothetical protein